MHADGYGSVDTHAISKYLFCFQNEIMFTIMPPFSPVLFVQEKQDATLPMVTEDMGVIGLSLSVGIICDGPVQLPDTVSSVLTKGKDVFWPAEPYHDFRGLPELWMGALRTANNAARHRTPPVITEQALHPQSYQQQPTSLPASPSQKSTTSTYTDGFESDGAANTAAVAPTQATTSVPDEGTPVSNNSPIVSEPSIRSDDSLLDVAEFTLIPPITEIDNTWQSAVSVACDSSMLLDCVQHVAVLDYDLQLKRTFMSFAGPNGCMPVEAVAVVRDVLSLLYAIA